VVLHRNDHVQALESTVDLERALEMLLDSVLAEASLEGIGAVVHRVVHGGQLFAEPTLLDDATVTRLSALDCLAPLHNPPAVAAIRHARSVLPNVPHVAVFDTAFHSTLPAHVREYALPLQLTQKFGIRRYGFHGTSHAHAMNTVAAYLHTQPQTLRIVSCHLGNGASVAAIEYGRSVETSMGFTPLEGLIMGTRAGDLDPGVLLTLLHSEHFDVDSLDAMLNKEAGLKGLTGTQDMKEIETRAAQGEEVCELAIASYVHRVRKYIGAYAAVMGGMEVLVFTAGIGEHSALIRRLIAQRLELLGIVLDEDRNRDARVDRTQPVWEISSGTSHVRVFVVLADEEAAMVREAAAMLERSARG
jgi:acetate kinase